MLKRGRKGRSYGRGGRGGAARFESGSRVERAAHMWQWEMHRGTNAVGKQRVNRG